ncbi:MAG: hypothetical protein VKL39_16650 [Leptolyngbyaceae bacterium]|nr:hypothetical protein [Leptolyngbyaceae bacterium]
MTQAIHVGNNSQQPENSDAQPSAEQSKADRRRSSRLGLTQEEDILKRIRSGDLLCVNSRRRNGLILFKKFHAEFAGPGAAVGSFLDLDCQDVYAVGSLSLLEPPTHEERQRAYLIRRQWIRLTYQFTDNTTPLKRAQMILNQFENYFDRETIAKVPDDAFAMMVGVLPHTIRLARRPPRKRNMRVKS